MALFDLLMNAVNNPSQQANNNDLGTLINTTQQLGTNYGLDAGTTQTVLSLVGNHVRSALQEQQNNGGSQQVENIVNQFGGFSPNNQAVQALFSSAVQTQIIDQIAQRTGLDRNTIQGMLPLLIPLVLKFLSMGGASGNSGGQNPLLNGFLDTDGDGDVDIADLMNLAGRYLGK